MTILRYAQMQATQDERASSKWDTAPFVLSAPHPLPIPRQRGMEVEYNALTILGLFVTQRGWR